MEARSRGKLCWQWPIEGVFRKTGIALHVVKIILESRGRWRRGVTETSCEQWPIEGVFRKTGISLHVVKIILESRGRLRRRVAKLWCVQWPIEGVFRKTGIPRQMVKIVESRGSEVAESRSRGAGNDQ